MMTLRHCIACTLILALPTLASGQSHQTAAPLALRATGPQKARIESFQSRTPILFESNRRQNGTQADFTAHGNGYALTLSGTEATMFLMHPEKQKTPTHKKSPRSAVPTVKADVLRMRLVNAAPNAKAVAEDRQRTTVNYYQGKDSQKWQESVPTFAKARYQGVYPGVDVVYYGNQKELEYDFVVAPGADTKPIALEFTGAKSLKIEKSGDLVLKTGNGLARWHKPVVYQEKDGKRFPIEGRYALRGSNRVGFEVAQYDRTKPLVIDPTFAYSTFFGYGSEFLVQVAADAAGNAYITGVTWSGIPLMNSTVQSSLSGNGDAFIAKFDASGQLVYSTYMGGSGYDAGYGIAADAAGYVYVTNMTNSPEWPVKNAFQPTYGGSGNSYAVKLDLDGKLIYSTFIGGSGEEIGNGIATDGNGNAYVVSWTNSSNFPTTANAFQKTAPYIGSTGVTKLGPNGELIYSTYLGGTNGIADNFLGAAAADPDGNCYVVCDTFATDFPVTEDALQPLLAGGSDIFLAKLSPNGSKLLYASYYGGSADEAAWDVALDPSGNVYLCGSTMSSDLPVASAFQAQFGGASNRAGIYRAGGDGLVVKYPKDFKKYIYASYIGGDAGDSANRLKADANGNAYVVGLTFSANFLTRNALQPAYAGNADAFVMKIDPVGIPLYSSYLGGNNGDDARGVAIDPSTGDILISGTSRSTSGFPLVNAYQTAQNGAVAYLAKLDLSDVKLKRLYVSPGGNDANDGLSWATAKRSLYNALTVAAEGTEVWAAGNYPGYLRVDPGRYLYGGFVGNESDLAQRDLAANPTVLENGDRGWLLYTPTGGFCPRIDGLVLQNSNQAMYIDNSPTLANCVVQGCGNGSVWSPAITGYGIAPSVVNCLVRNNLAAGDGGGLLLGASRPYIADSTFDSNTANRGGGGIHLWAACKPIIIGNTISNNVSKQWGGGFFMPGSQMIVMLRNTISNNKGGQYGGADISTSAPLAFRENVVSDNTGTDVGGVIRNGTGYVLVSKNTFSGNHGGEGAIQFGGTQGGHVWGNTFSNNIADNGSGGLNIVNASGIYVDFNSVTGNTGKNAGGIGINNGGFFSLYGNTVTDNKSANVGGIFGGGSYLTLGGNTITGNRGDGVGGVSNWTNYVTIYSNTIANNWGGSIGGMGLWGNPGYVGGNAIYNNEGPDGIGGLHMDGTSLWVAYNWFSANKGGWISGVNNFNANNDFVLNYVLNHKETGTALAFYGEPANNLFSTNMIAQNDAGVYMYESPMTVTNNTFIANSNGTWGGAFWADGSQPKLYNNLVAFNQFGLGTSGTLTGGNNLVYGNTNFDYFTGTPLTGDVNADPQFADAGYHLKPTSPAINTGDNSHLGVDWQDIEGNTRVVGSSVDIGVYEYQGIPTPVLATASPNPLAAGAPDTTLTINGNGFMPNSVVKWNGQERSATFVSATKMTVTIPASDLTKPGVALVTVTNPDNGSISNALSVKIAAPGITSSFTISRDEVTKQVVVTLTLTNSGGGYAKNVKLTTAVLRSSAPGSPTLPKNLGTIAPGSSVTVSLHYAKSTAAGRTTLRIAGSHTLGTFSGTYRVTVP